MILLTLRAVSGSLAITIFFKTFHHLNRSVWFFFFVISMIEPNVLRVRFSSLYYVKKKELVMLLRVIWEHTSR